MLGCFLFRGTYKYDVITFRDIFTPPPPFPTASSFGTLVGGAHLMMSYLNKHFEPVPILCAVDFCLESRPVNPIVYLVKKSESGIQKYLLYLFYLFRMCSMWQSGYLLVDDLRVLWCFCKALPQNTIIMSYFAWPPTPVSTLASSCVIFPQTSGWHLLMTSYLYVPLSSLLRCSNLHCWLTYSVRFASCQVLQLQQKQPIYYIVLKES